MVDLTLFHYQPGKAYPRQDRMNRRTNRFTCNLLEWIGWYNSGIDQRLLGHYRLYQLFKREPEHRYTRMNPVLAYIYNYRSTHGAKYFLARSVSLLYSFISYGKFDSSGEMATFNRALIHEHAGILQEFLTEADTDFTGAFLKAMWQFGSLALDRPAGQPGALSPVALIQFHNYNSHQHTSYSYNEVNVHLTVKEGAKGKEKDVFSKKQVLILFDLLNKSASLEKVDFSKPNRYDAIAGLLHALTGKGQQSWVEELNDHKDGDLYTFHTQGELNQLISMITNLGDFFRKAGFRSVAAMADKKIRELEVHKKD